MLISTLVDQKAVSAVKRVWQYMLISTLVDGIMICVGFKVWQYMLISTLVDRRGFGNRSRLTVYVKFYSRRLITDHLSDSQ